jgi:hypothetical protein
VSAASDPEAWAAFSTRFLEVEDEAAYRAAVEAWHAEEGR